MHLSIIIVSYNVRYFLEQCLYSVRRASDGLGVEVIVVDNASADESLSYLPPLFPEVRFIASPTNLGFAKACNLGLQHASGDHILFLNPDVLLAEDTLRLCLRFLGEQPRAGALGVRMVDGSGNFLKESKRGFPGPLTSFFKLSGFSKLFPRSRVFSRYYLGHLPEHQNSEVDVLAGAFMLIPRAVLQAVGAFDEAFFMYGEDIDLSYRIRQAGYSNYYFAGTSIIHFKGESTSKESLQYVRHFYAAMRIFVRKHYRGAGAGAFYLLLQLAIWGRAAMAAAGQGWRKVKALLGKGTPRKSSNAGKEVFAIASSREEYECLKNLLQQKGFNSTWLAALPEAGLPLPAPNLVLCADTGFTYKDVIQFIQQGRSGLHFYFHAVGSGSIVGSAASTRSGVYIGL